MGLFAHPGFGLEGLAAPPACALLPILTDHARLQFTKSMRMKTPACVFLRGGPTMMRVSEWVISGTRYNARPLANAEST